MPPATPHWTCGLGVALGGALGSWLRWRVTVWLANASWPATWPISAGTLGVNCAGGLLIGASLVVFGRCSHEGLRLMLVTGVLGGLTTFSAFSAESLTLLLKGQFGLAILHSALHVLGGLAFAGLGWRLASAAWPA